MYIKEDYKEDLKGEGDCAFRDYTEMGTLQGGHIIL